MPFATDHPLLIPEISLHISRFVAIKDAIACARVCKAWNDPFTSAVWHTVNFKAQKRFVETDPVIIKKHGNRVRVVKRISASVQLEVLHKAGVCLLQRFSLVMQTQAQFQALYFDLLYRNANSLTRMEIGHAEDCDKLVVFPVGLMSSCAGSHASFKLVRLCITNLAMTRDAFASLLKLCPALKFLEVQRTSIYSYSSCPEPFRHTGLVHLNASLEQIFQPDPGSLTNVPILVHLPRLKRISTALAEPDALTPVSFGAMKDQFAKYCHSLGEVVLTTAPITTTALLTRTFRSLTMISISAEKMSIDVITAMLVHQETLSRVIAAVHRQSDRDSELEGQPTIPGWALQLIPQTCSRLTRLYFQPFTLDMEEIERTTWSCNQLEELHIQIRGLDTKEKIDRAMRLWTNCRDTRRKSKKGNSANGSGLHSSSTQSGLEKDTLRNGKSLEERVARHLARFEKLRVVRLCQKGGSA
ncbi:MAG: hypothetical protein J3Q66DRAFT_321833 [Benniella sp.]|nr:MAG: hypothetical protein J3Q66DRAFT_321833 [Benniella sp.]